MKKSEVSDLKKESNFQAMAEYCVSRLNLAELGLPTLASELAADMARCATVIEARRETDFFRPGSRPSPVAVPLPVVVPKETFQLSFKAGDSLKRVNGRMLGS